MLTGYHDNVGQMCRAQSVDAAGAPDHRSTHVGDGDGERACGETEQEDPLGGLGGTEDGGRTWAKGSNSKNKCPQHPAANPHRNRSETSDQTCSGDCAAQAAL